MRKKEDKYDFRAFGLAIKEARKKQGLTREQVGAMIDNPVKSSRRRQLESKIDNFTDADLVIMESVADGIVKYKEMEDK